MEPQYIASLIILGLGCIAWYMIQQWAKSWKTRLIAHDERLAEHEERHLKADIKLAVIGAELKYIKDTTDSTSADVKKILQNVGTHRSAG